MSSKIQLGSRAVGALQASPELLRSRESKANLMPGMSLGTGVPEAPAPQASIPRQLVFATEAAGHWANYINTFVRYAVAHQETGSLTFAISDDLVHRLAPEVIDILQSPDRRIRLRLLTDHELASANNARFEVQRNFSRWRLALRIAEELDVSSILFPLVDDIMKAASVLPDSRLSISGIYFRPTMHFPESWRGLKAFLRQAGKAFFVKRYLRRRDTAALFTFDPYFTNHARRRYAKGDKVITIAEPIDMPRGNAPETAAEGQLRRQVNFLMFGGLQRRKGVRELLDALLEITPEYRDKIRVVICGEGELGSEIESCLPDIRRRGIQIEFEHRFLTEAELNARYLAADVFLAPYRDHIGSSGVLYVAASLHRPVIAQNSGLVGRQVVHHRLGEAVDTANPREIARSMERMVQRIVRREPSDADYDGFTSGHGCSAFAKAALIGADARDPERVV